MVIFGASGDLTKRLLMPALYNLARAGRLSEKFALIGVDRSEKTHEDFREELADRLLRHPSSKRRNQDAPAKERTIISTGQKYKRTSFLHVAGALGARASRGERCAIESNRRGR